MVVDTDTGGTFLLCGWLVGWFCNSFRYYNREKKKGVLIQYLHDQSSHWYLVDLSLFPFASLLRRFVMRFAINIVGLRISIEFPLDLPSQPPLLQ
jgi:hypothetical protein